MAEGGGLLNRYRGVNPYRGFESLLLRHFFYFKHKGNLLAKAALLLFYYPIFFYLIHLVKPLFQVFLFFPPYYKHGDSDHFFLYPSLFLPIIVVS